MDAQADLNLCWVHMLSSSKCCARAQLFVVLLLQEDDLENLQMSYTSYSENKISEGMVAQFIIHLMLKYREPRFLEVNFSSIV